MYSEQFRAALNIINSKETIDNLKEIYRKEKAGIHKEIKKYSDLIAIYDSLRKEYAQRKLDINEYIPFYTSKNDYFNDFLKTIKKTDKTDKQEEKEYESIEIFSTLKPEPQMTTEYKILYFKTFINWMLNHYNHKYDRHFFKHAPLLSYFRDIDILYLDTIECICAVLFRSEINELPDKHKLTYLLTNIQKKIATIEEYTTNELDLLRFYLQLILFLLCIPEFNAHVSKASYNEAFSYISLFLARGNYYTEKKNIPVALYFAKKSLNIYDYEQRESAFITLGIIASHTENQLQLAYDTYFSLIHRKACGSIQQLFTLDSQFKEKNKNDIQISMEKQMIPSFFANICCHIGDTYERDSVRYIIFYKIAEKTLNDISDFHSYSDPFLNLTHNQILYALNRHNPDIIHSFLPNFSPHYLPDMPSSIIIPYINTHIQIIMDLLMDSFTLYFQNNNITIDNIVNWSKTSNPKYYLSELNERYNESIGLVAAETDREAETKKIFEELLGFKNNYPSISNISTIAIILIIIRKAASDIFTDLRRYDYFDEYYTRIKEYDNQKSQRSKGETFAYYTTLKTASYLFDDLTRKATDKAPVKAKEDDNCETKNCLTITHPKYMNDPQEGLVLLESLTKDISESNLSIFFPEGSVMRFREKIYNEKFIFLKSFTEQIDNLIMWNRYASDSDVDGKNSNGCCILFDPLTFSHYVDDLANDEPLTQSNDESALYRLVYVSSDGKLKRNKNLGIKQKSFDEINNNYEILKKLMKELGTLLTGMQNKYGKTKHWDPFISDIRASLRQSFYNIMFLFKSDDYADECESRLIFTRTSNQQASITLLPGTPNKIAINPYKQVYIRKIILGPNVKNPEEWKPFLQYGLNNIWNKYIKETGDDSQPVYEQYTIENSKIHYRT